MLFILKALNLSCFFGGDRDTHIKNAFRKLKLQDAGG